MQERVEMSLAVSGSSNPILNIVMFNGWPLRCADPSIKVAGDLKQGIEAGESQAQRCRWK
jgi:hypothetical protein